MINAKFTSVQYFNSHTTSSSITELSWWCGCSPVVNMGIFPISNTLPIWGKHGSERSLWLCNRVELAASQILHPTCPGLLSFSISRFPDIWRAVWRGIGSLFLFIPLFFLKPQSQWTIFQTILDSRARLTTDNLPTKMETAKPLNIFICSTRPLLTKDSGFWLNKSGNLNILPRELVRMSSHDSDWNFWWHFFQNKENTV